MDTSETIDSLRVHVRRGLDRFCMGQYFMEYGLQETAVLIPEGANPDDLESCGLMEKKSPFQLFLKAVASEIVKEKGVTKGRKKAIKEYLEILQAFAGEWVAYIRKNMRKKLQNKSSILGSPDGKFHPASPDAHHHGDDAGGGGGDGKKKKGAKRGPRGPYKKRKQPPASSFNSPAGASNSSTPSPSKKAKPAPTDAETARREFEEAKQEVMSKIPEKNKRLFNQVGWAKWGKGNLPAMVLNPYGVPPGDIREQWLKMFQNVVEKDRISKMGHLVWWIGPQTDGQSSYSVVPSNGFITYEEGTRKNMHELPSKIKKLMERGKELNKSQAEVMESLRILNELALQPEDDREHPRSDFMEEDYWGLDEEELQGDDEEEEERKAPAAAKSDKSRDNEDEEELLDDEEDLKEADSGKPSKKKKGKKRKKDAVVLEEDCDEDQTEIIYDDIEEVTPAAAPPPKKKKKKDKAKLERGKKKKKKKKSMDGAEAGEADKPSADDNKQPADAVATGEENQDVEMAEVEDGKPAAKQQQPNEDVPMDGGAIPAVAAPDPAREDSPAEDPSVSADSALVDSDYGDDTDEQLGGVKNKSKLKKKGKKKDDANDDEDDDPKAKKGKKKKAKDKAPKEPKKKKSRAVEQRDLQKCEEEYLPMIEELRLANEMKDVSMIQQCFEALMPVAELFCASFFSEYEIPQLMKSIKKVLEDAESRDLQKRLWKKMKITWEEKVKLLPDGFTAKKSKSAKAKSSGKTSDDEQQQPTVPSAAKEEKDAVPQSTPVQRPEPAVAAVPTPQETSSATTTPAAKSSSKDDSRRTSVAGDQQPPKTAEKASSVKPKQKKFSVMDFTNKKKENKRVSVGGGPDKVVPSAALGSATKRKAAPSWVTSPLQPFDNFAGCARREDRLFAMEFLLQAAAHFPSDKGVNEASVARSLELAIYEFSESKSNWSDVYWDKLHSIVAALTGKRELGTLIGMIMDGSFASPKSIIALSVENLEHSFEGRPLTMSGE